MPGVKENKARERRIEMEAVVNAYKWVGNLFRVTGAGLKGTVQVEVAPEDGVSKQKADEPRTGLRELRLNDNLKS